MILGFALQVTALRFGALALVQPILAVELLFVFGYMAVLGSRQVRPRDWLAALSMSAGLASHALASGPLASSQPGFTIADPLAASLLGIFLFGEHIQAATLDLAAEAAGLALILTGTSALSHSQLIHGENRPPGARLAFLGQPCPGPQEQQNRSSRQLPAPAVDHAARRHLRAYAGQPGRPDQRAPMTGCAATAPPWPAGPA
jgi:drug/metabolite transporter (DMT)-like permease